MARTNCTGDMANTSGRCCDKCPAGTYVQAHCDGHTTTKPTCSKCPNGFYTATKNYLRICQRCKTCSFESNERTSKQCLATQNAECECKHGYFSSDVKYNVCHAVSLCPEGEGVVSPAGRTTDTVCAPCVGGTYSNTSDSISPCRPHTRCEDFGRELKAVGTATRDSVCGQVLGCSWMLPAGLWAGLVLTALVLLVGAICWRVWKRRTRAAGRSRVPPVDEKVSAELVTALHMPVASTVLTNHCQDSCGVEEYKFSIYHTDTLTVDSSAPITPLSFTEPTHNPGTAGHRTGNLLRSRSEPQEDEWS